MDRFLDFFFHYVEPHIFFYLFPLYFIFEYFFRLNKKQKLLGSEVPENFGWVLINNHVLEYVINFAGSLIRISFLPILWNTYIDSNFNFFEGHTIRIENALVLTLIIFISRDFMGWVVHRMLLHKVPFLWKFHMLHHSSTEVNALAGMRGNWLENILFDLGFSIPLIIFEVPPVGYTLIALWEANLAFFVHSNVNLRKKGLFRFFVSPLYHHWHHAIDCHYKQGQNFGVYTNIFDRLFGTYYCPDELPKEYGIKDQTFPKGIIARFFYPLIPSKVKTKEVRPVIGPR